REGKIERVWRSIVLASSVTTGTRKKFPMAARNRCSSTLPESSTWVVQEPPLRFCASWAASSRDSTPPAIKRSTIDLLTAALIRFEIIDPTGVIARGKISGTHRGHLVKQPMSIARRQRIGGRGGKDFLIQNKRTNALAAEKQRDKKDPDSFHQCIPTSLADGTSGGGSCFPSPRFGQSGQSSCSNSGPKWVRSSFLCRRRYKSS